WSTCYSSGSGFRFSPSNVRIPCTPIFHCAARASRTLNQDAIDGAMVEILADPKEARAGNRYIHFFRFYLSLDFFNTRADLWKRDHLAIDKYHVRGLRSLVVAGRTVPEKNKPLVVHVKSLCIHIRRAFKTSVSTLMITETRPKLGTGSNMIHSISFYRDKRAIRGSLGSQVTFSNLYSPHVIFFAKTDDCQTDDFTRRYISMIVDFGNNLNSKKPFQSGPSPSI
ncbi:hypothetical protein HID58_081562, partial [Brassica napus]